MVNPLHFLRDQTRTYFQFLHNQHTSSVAQLPRWRHPLIGYLISLLLVGLGLGVGLVEIRLQSPFSFPGVPLLFAIVFVAFFWGAGPAIFTVLLGLLVLDYLYVPPLGTLSRYEWDGLLQLLTFAAAGMIIAIFASQREAARLRAVAAEREAVLRAHQLSTTFDAMNDSIVVYQRKGQMVLQTNASANQLFGSDAFAESENEQALRKQNLLLQATQHDERGQLLPLKRQPLARIFRGEVLTGTKATDVLLHTRDGREVVLNLSGAPIRGETGSVERAVLIYREVTERRRLERRTSEALQALLAIAEALARFPEQPSQDEALASTAGTLEQVGQRIVELVASAVESMHVVMIAVEPEEDRITPTAFVGLTPSLQEQWKEQLARSPSLVDALRNETLASYLKDGEVLLLDGMSLPLYANVLPYYIQTMLVAPICVEGRLMGLLCVDAGSREHAYTTHEMRLVQTIARLTALILARAQLQQERMDARSNEPASREASRQMEAYLSIVCHELKTPLTIMRGSIQLAEHKVKRLVSREAPPPDELKRFAPVQALLERTKHAIAIQDRLVNDLLDVSHIQARSLNFIITPCNLVSIVQEVVEGQRYAVPAHTIHLARPPEPEECVQADADRLAQVITNLLTNALKYSPEDQPVEVTLCIAKQNVRVSVSDRGAGLPQSEHERVWQRFYRAPGIEVQSGSGVGLGVGLHLCRTIIEQHGGQVGVQSVPGQGSTFWFSLPLEHSTQSII